MLCAVAALTGCKGSDGSGFSAFANIHSSTSTQTFTLGASISGLDSSGLILTVNATSVSVAAGASTQVLASALASGTSYAVTVQRQPTGQLCTVAGGSG